MASHLHIFQTIKRPQSILPVTRPCWFLEKKWHRIINTTQEIKNKTMKTMGNMINTLGTNSGFFKQQTSYTPDVQQVSSPTQDTYPFLVRHVAECIFKWNRDVMYFSSFYCDVLSVIICANIGGNCHTLITNMIILSVLSFIDKSCMLTNISHMRT